MTEEKMMERMRERNKNPLEAWREILALFAEDDETVIKQKKRVDRALKRAEKKMREEGIEIWDGPEKDEYILESYPNVKKMIDEATMELAYYCKDNNDWDRFEKMILSNSFAMQVTFDYLFNIIPDERKYSLTVNAYSWGGAAKEGVQNAIKKLPEYGKPELPDDMDDIVTIYRGCTGGPDQAAESFSWTTNPEVAKWFCRVHENRYGRTGRIYSGKIRKTDIAAYNTELGQDEVIQLGKVFDVADITEEETKMKISLQQLRQMDDFKEIAQPETVYHMTDRKNLKSILYDGKIRSYRDFFTFFFGSLEDIPVYIELMHADEGRMYHGDDGWVHKAPPLNHAETVVLKLRPRRNYQHAWFREAFGVSKEECSYGDFEVGKKLQEYLNDVIICHYRDMPFEKDPEIIELTNVDALPESKRLKEVRRIMHG